MVTTSRRDDPRRYLPGVIYYEHMAGYPSGVSVTNCRG